VVATHTPTVLVYRNAALIPHNDCKGFVGVTIQILDDKTDSRAPPTFRLVEMFAVDKQHPLSVSRIAGVVFL
jgi:hypothetical protein